MKYFCTVVSKCCSSVLAQPSATFALCWFCYAHLLVHLFILDFILFQSVSLMFHSVFFISCFLFKTRQQESISTVVLHSSSQQFISIYSCASLLNSLLRLQVVVISRRKTFTRKLPSTCSALSSLPFWVWIAMVSNMMW